MRRGATACAVHVILVAVLVTSGGCALPGKAEPDAESVEAAARTSATAVLDRAAEEGVTTGPAIVNTLWRPCPDDSTKRSLTVRGIAKVSPGKLATADEARRLSETLDQIVRGYSGPMTGGLESRFPGTHGIVSSSRLRHAVRTSLTVPIMDELGNDDGVLVVDNSYFCVAPPPQVDEEAAIRAMVERAATTVAGVPAAPAKRKPCDESPGSHTWLSTAQLPVTDDLATTIATDLARLSVRDGWTLVYRANSGDTVQAAKSNLTVHVAVEGSAGATATVRATTGCWPVAGSR